MTHKWGRMATYPKLGDSQLSNQEQKPHGETPHSMRVYVPSRNCLYPWSSGARNLRPKIKGETGFVAILGKTTKVHPKVVKKSYLRITEEMSLGPLHGCKPKLYLPFAIRVVVQGIMEASSTPKTLKHSIYGKTCIYPRYWYVHIFGSLRNKNMSKHFWSRPKVGASKYAHHG